MSTDSLKQAIDGMESAWRRLREVLDGPDVAAALVEASNKPRPMSTAPRDGTWVEAHAAGLTIVVRWRASIGQWRSGRGDLWADDVFVGWSPVK
jgi:hypothetical protein